MSYVTLKESYERFKKQRKEYFLFDDVLIFVADPLPEDVKLQNVIDRVKKNMSRSLFEDLDYIYIGQFDELKVRQVESVYMRGAIYIINDNQTEEKLFDSIVHELGHSVETVYGDKLYGDNLIIDEFLMKRKQVKQKLESEKLFIDPSYYSRIEFCPPFDEFLYKKVGYDRLGVISSGIFVSPYGCTSLREYFANGFEHYFSGDRQYLQSVSPRLYEKIFLLTKKKR